MPAKKKIIRQKKNLNMVATKATDDLSLLDHEAKRYEDAIRHQMYIIKKDYNRLLTDVSKGYGLVKHWVGSQAMTKGEMLRSRFIRSNN